MAGELIVTEVTTPSTPAAGKEAIFISNDATPRVKRINSAATVLTSLETGVAAPAGTTSVPPLQLTAGTNLTSATAGAIEFDGTSFYATSAASSRQVVSTDQFTALSSPYTLTNTGSAQQLFNGSANGAVTLAIGTYFFETQFTLSSMSSSSGVFSFGFATGGTIGSVAYTALGDKAALTETTALLTFGTSASATALNAANTTTTGGAYIKGIVRMTVAGTLTPQITLGVGAAAVVATNSWFRIAPIGGSSVATVGNWS